MKHFRLLIVWVLLLAIPLQGYASVTMLLCATGTPAAAAQVHDGGKPVTKLHHAAQTESVSVDEAPADNHCTSPSGVSKCSSCAACCVVAGNSHPITPLVTAKPVGSECIPYIAVFDTAHVPTGLERPPHCGDA